MLDLSKLPTDNLYKFMALGGLVLIAVAAFFFVTQSNHLANHRLELRKETNALSIDLTDAVLQQLLEEAKRKAYRTLAAKVDDAEQKQDNAFDDLDAYLFAVLGPKSREYRIKAANLKHHVEQVRYLQREQEAAEKLSFYGACVGAFLTGLGFTLWWWKIQRYEDRILRNQAAEQPTAPVTPAPASPFGSS